MSEMISATHPRAKTTAQPASIGYVVGGGLKENLRVRLTVPAQEVQEGSFVIIDSGDWRFYGLVTDLQLGRNRPALCRRAERNAPARRAGRAAARADAVYQPGSDARADAGNRPGPRQPALRGMAQGPSRTTRAPSRSKPSLRTTPPCAGPRPAMWPKFLATRMKKAISSSAIPASRATRSAWTWRNSCSAPRASLARPAPANPF